MLDEELRAGLAEWVRPVAALPVPDIRALRRRARRRGIRRAAAAAAVTAVVAATAVGITVSTARSPAPLAPLAAPGTWYPGRWLPAGALAAPGAGPASAPYVITIGGGPGLATVTDAFTGRTLGTVDPYPGESIAGVAAAGNDRTFLVAAQGGTSVRFYEERLDPAGRPGPLVLVFSLPGHAVPWFALSPDGRLLAYATPGQINVISLATGARRSWAADGGKAIDLSLAGNGMLAFEWLPGGALAKAQVRLLNTAASGVSGSGLEAARGLVPGCANRVDLLCLPLSPLITPDGSAVFATYLFNGKGGLVEQVQEFSARTGQLLRTVTPAVASQRQSVICEALWSDAGGSQLAAFCGRAGTIADGRFSPTSWTLPAGSLSRSGESVAW